VHVDTLTVSERGRPGFPETPLSRMRKTTTTSDMMKTTWILIRTTKQRQELPPSRKQRFLLQEHLSLQSQQHQGHPLLHSRGP
jgi:hypothetical protein